MANRYSEHANFIPAEEQQRSLPALPQPDLLSARQVADVATKMLDTYSQQQRATQSAVRAVQGEVLEPGDRGISSASEIAERRKTSRQYLLTLILGHGMTVGGIVALVGLATVKGAGIEAPGLLWPAAWILGTGALTALSVSKLSERDQLHTPEGLARLRERNEHEVRLLQAHAEARRFDVGTRLLEEQVRRQALENKQLELALADAAKVEPQSHSNMLASYVPEPENVLAEHEAFRQKLLAYLADPSNRDDNGRFHGTVPWSARGSFTKPESERAKRLFEHAEHYAGHWLVRYDGELRAWRLNVQKLPNARAVLAAFADVELTK